MTVDRRQLAYNLRVEAAEKARARPFPNHLANGDEQRWAAANYAMSFTKGLPHSNSTGLIGDRRDFEAFRRAIDEGYIDRFSLNVPVASGATNERREWEAPTAGVAGDLQGPDAQAVTMAPAPALGSLELAYEMAEVYELALLREVELRDFRAEGPAAGPLQDSLNRLNGYGYALDGNAGRKRKNEGGDVTRQTAFRGSSPGVEIGPYLSQFMLIGNADLRGDPTQADQVGLADGFIGYGAQLIDQRVPVAMTTNFMRSRPEWLEVQRGGDTRRGNSASLFVQTGPRRFITTPRDLATYVHDDALYQAYLNACLILLGQRAPFDPGFAHLAGGRDLFTVRPNATHAAIDLQATGFALYGGPHILSLVTEVATRALKAVRFQKFNNHIRLRPEALAGRIEYARDPGTPGSGSMAEVFPAAAAAFNQLEGLIQATVDAVIASDADQTRLLPMAFQEGSPMHPAYGAGHATVAGACVTILKAFFDTDARFMRRTIADGNGDTREQTGFLGSVPAGFTLVSQTNLQYVPEPGGATLDEENPGTPLTLEGELNKLAANISIGRNMGGVHYFSDYYDSVRMGEEIAIGILEEQALCYPTDPFVLTVPTFDGGIRRIGAR